ncbi:type VII toxin-antitoxin system HepT family RNase toxin [Desulfovirgula thermocuniculi]|uniref:type VII toxin-antitoxin system HepT family RNase toxin n=1 Tax=Desulfovirgula thermocuniculi TaxID=348842 RepID=UPI000552AFAD|nr:DUF86 domain-containing protein [Desulfovirgula thermocuniculi]
MKKKRFHLNIDLITTKAADIEKAVALLDEIGQTPKESFLSDPILISGAKYQLILAIEAAQNICNHLAARVAKEVPSSYADCFRILGREKIISVKLAEKLVSMARFRNLLVHHYAKVDDAIVYGIIKAGTADLLDYIKEIKAFVDAASLEEQKK